MRHDVVPRNFAARLGHYAFDAGTPLCSGTWRAARAGAACAVAGARALRAGGGAGARESAFVLTRPPGHHAGADSFGGYCLLNNSALAAQVLRDAAFERVGVLDLDYHHGNGTQSLFYERSDVFTVSIQPGDRVPLLPGLRRRARERRGRGFNLNLPLPRGTRFPAWRDALRQALS